MRERKAHIIVIVLATLTMVWGAVFAYATGDGDIKATQDKLGDVNAQLNSVKNQLREGKKLENQLNREIQSLESKINKSQAQINAIGSDIAVTQNNISVAMAELAEMEKNMETQNNNLNARLRAMYKNGSIGFLDILLDSGSVTNFMTNMDRIQLIYENDKMVMENLKAQHQMISSKKQNLLNLQTQLVSKQNTAKEMKNSLKKDQSEVAVKKAEVASDNKALEEMEKAFLAEANRLKAEILAAQSKGTTYVGGVMTWPTPGYTKINSPFGYRIHPIFKVRKLHTGVDIGAPTGANVVAANSGKVIKAAWNNSYGNVIFIDHDGGIVTVYAHNSALLVKAGDVVSRGQVIAKVGSTGNSTGPHLHFEVRKNGDYVDPRGGWI